MIDTFLFDFDGTLVDTAVGLNHAVNVIRQGLGLAPLPLAITTPITGNGAKALLLAGNDIHDNIDQHVNDLFDYYQKNIFREIKLFEGIEQALKTIESAGFQWGIVTNRSQRFTLPLLTQLNLPSQPQVVVCADMVTHIKPHPESLIQAYTYLKKPPENCIFIGDSIRDIQAGKAAGIKTVAATYGYIEAQDDPLAWQADYYVNHPKNLLNLFKVL